MLVTGTVSPVWAGEAAEPGAPPVVELGSFAVGDGVEALVNEADGSFGVQIPVAGLSVSWDSRVPVDRYAFGVGWGYGFAVVEVAGGVRVSPSSGGTFAADTTVPSGLAGYQGTDVVFRQVPGGVLEARGDGVAGAREYAFELHELGGMVTYFNAAGDPVASVTATGGRTDWRWATGAGHHLASVVSVDGVVTELDWSDPGEVLVRPGVNVPADGGGAGTWRLGLDGGRLTEVTDPVGGWSRVGYDDAGRIDRLVSGSGAATRVQWRSDADGVSRVDRVGVTDVEGTELSARQWRQLDGALPTGWPAVDAAGVTGPRRASEGRSVELSDGSTRVVSEFDAWGRLTGKQLLASTAAGEQVVQEQELTYPDGDPIGVGGLTGKPAGMEVRFLDAAGGVRAGTESYAYDESGRMLRRQSADGTVLEFGYDSEMPAGRVLPVGATVLQRSTAEDGSVTTTESELDATRTVPVLVEQWMQAPGAEPVVTGRTEYTARDGVVVEQREYPGGDGNARPVLTRWDEHVDLGRGVREVTETVAADTDLESTTSSVSSVLHGGALSSTDVLGRTSTASYDEVGRPVRGADGSRFEWDAANRQNAQTTPEGVRIESSHWADGTRKARTTEVGSTTYYWDDSVLVNERYSTEPTESDAGAGGIASYLIGTSRHARITSAGAESPAPAETTYYATDRHGNVTALTDESGAIAGTYSYSDYGVATSGPGVTRPAAGLPGAVGQLSYNPFQYSLEYTHADGTQFLSERTYDPTQMSFTRKDVASLHDLYGYVNANPIMLVDPTGRFSFWDFATIGVTTVGAAAGLYGVFGALAAVFTTAASGGTLLAIGLIAGSISVANAAFAGMELYSAVSGIRFMSERDAFFTGLALGAAGGFAAVGGRGALKLGRPGARSAVAEEGTPLRDFKDVTSATLAERDPYPSAPLSEWKALRATENLQDADPRATKRGIDAMRTHVRELDELFMKVDHEDGNLMDSLTGQLHTLERTVKSADLDDAYQALVKWEASIQALVKGTGSRVLPDADLRTIWRADDQILAVRSAMSELDATAKGLTTDGGKAFSQAVSRVRAYADQDFVTFDVARDKF
ncbi:RHS repeat domain-containing protein [Agromyces silvae]|uniref:RHS repeat domain-containing protein n=1 Tax=Agromyces silvae TaxID=3388266 RepID=UPI00280BE67A|nr:RHS repeat-associated core domain-containing protein [Agromyces protaetiae]